MMMLYMSFPKLDRLITYNNNPHLSNDFPAYFPFSLQNKEIERDGRDERDERDGRE